MMKRNLFKSLIGLFFLSIFVFSCDNELHINMPEGPTGPAGKSAYELWVEGVENSAIDWPKDRTTIEQFYLYMKGRDGKDGQNGQDGLSAYELWIKEVESGVKDPHNPGKEWDKTKVEINDFWYFLTGADGKDGKNGSTPVIGDNGNWWIDGEDTGMPSRGANGQNGKDGSKIEISNNQTWIIDGTDTGVPVNGKDGNAGKDGSVVTIGDNGNWYIDGIDTTVPARGVDGSNGTDGTNGKDGLSAYEVWVTEVMKGIDNPHNPGEKWDKSKISMDDFWFYLRGKAGVDGQNGKDGEDGSKIEISNNNTWIIDGTDTGIPVNGKDGKDGDKVTIGDNNNWHINDIDTGIPARGVDGEKGETGQPGRDGSIVTIGDNGNWHIDGEDTNVPAFGKDGDDGAPGQSGSNGLSAYELWKQDVATGNLDDPKKPGQKWPTNKDTVQNFWEYLTGKDGKDGQDGNDGSGSSGHDGKDGVDGKSAYELWTEEVAKGIENPHKPGTDWPQDQTTINDFWEFLRGKDGKDGKDGQDGSDGKPGEPGKPGESVILVKGVPNVIAQYSMQEMSEYVRWTDGSVYYIVYNDIGQPSPNAKVSGMPGVKDPQKVYTADENGSFYIPKEDLPQGKPISEIVGKSTSVTYYKSTGSTVTEASAENTYVPNKINIRLVRTKVCALSTQTVNVPMRVERHIGTPEADWEEMPMYFANMKQSFKAYELADKDDPLSFDRNNKPAYSAERELNNGLVSLERPKIKAPYMEAMSGIEWDREEHYYVAEMTSFYGESAMLKAVIQSVPIQYGPIISEIKNVGGYGEASNTVAKLSVVFDISHLDHRYFYEKCDYITKTINGVDYEYWSPLLATNVDDRKIFEITFNYKLPEGNDTSDNVGNRASINEPESALGNVHVLSTVTLKSAYPTLVSALSQAIGVLKYDEVNKKLNFIGTKNTYLNVPDILDIPVED